MRRAHGDGFRTSLSRESGTFSSKRPPARHCSMTRLQIALSQINAAREYTQTLLAEILVADWFRQPTPAVTHVAWQVGHLAMAEYRLGLERIRGPRAEDAELISPAILQQFGRDSTPHPDPAVYPSPEELRDTLDRVHAQLLAEIPAMPDADLDLPPYKEHKLFTTRLGSLLWCSRHEMLHAGQIGLVRRLLGARPIW
jgi:hypothetical protein